MDAPLASKVAEWFAEGFIKAAEESKASLAYIREHYKVPAKKGVRVTAQGQRGKIVGAEGTYLRILLDDEQEVKLYHPTWEIQYPREKEK